MPASFSFEAIGTQWTVEILESHVPADLEQAVRRRIDRFDSRYSRFRGDAWVAGLAHAAGRYEVPADGRPMIELYRALYEVSNGAVTPLVGQALVEAGYDGDYSLQPKPVGPVPAWDDVFAYDGETIDMRRPALLDFGALGKGRLVDLVAATLRRQGVNRYVVNAGGDLRHADPGQGTVDVALEHPTDPTLAIGVCHLSNQSLCGSARDITLQGKPFYEHPTVARLPGIVGGLKWLPWICLGIALIALALIYALRRSMYLVALCLAVSLVIAGLVAAITSFSLSTVVDRLISARIDPVAGDIVTALAATTGDWLRPAAIVTILAGAGLLIVLQWRTLHHLRYSADSET